MDERYQQRLLAVRVLALDWYQENITIVIIAVIPFISGNAAHVKLKLKTDRVGRTDTETYSNLHNHDK